MAADPKPRKKPNRVNANVMMTLDPDTLRGLDEMLAEEPGLMSRSAAVRKLVRERPRRPKPDS